MSGKEAKRIFAEQADTLTRTIGEEALSDIFFVELKEAKHRTQKYIVLLYRRRTYGDGIKDFMDDMFERNHEL